MPFGQWPAEVKQVAHWHVQLEADPLQHIKAGRIDPALDQAEEIDADADEFGELFLRQLSGQPDRPEPTPELSPE